MTETSRIYLASSMYFPDVADLGPAELAFAQRVTRRKDGSAVLALVRAVPDIPAGVAPYTPREAWDAITANLRVCPVTPESLSARGGVLNTWISLRPNKRPIEVLLTSDMVADHIVWNTDIYVSVANSGLEDTEDQSSTPISVRGQLLRSNVDELDEPGHLGEYREQTFAERDAEQRQIKFESAVDGVLSRMALRRQPGKRARDTRARLIIDLGGGEGDSGVVIPHEALARLCQMRGDIVLIATDN